MIFTAQATTRYCYKGPVNYSNFSELCMHVMLVVKNSSIRLIFALLSPLDCIVALFLCILDAGILTSMLTVFFSFQGWWTHLQCVHAHTLLHRPTQPVVAWFITVKMPPVIMVSIDRLTASQALQHPWIKTIHHLRPSFPHFVPVARRSSSSASSSATAVGGGSADSRRGDWLVYWSIFVGWLVQLVNFL